MAQFRINKNQNYTNMSNYHLRDRTLSLKAIGLHSKMLSLPEDWDYSIQGLVSICKEGESCIIAILNELKEHRYLKITKLYPKETGSGRFEYIYDVYEYPYNCDDKCNQEGEKQDLENQGLEFQGLENQGQINTKELNTNNIEENIKRNEVSPETYSEMECEPLNKNNQREKKNKLCPQKERKVAETQELLDLYNAQGFNTNYKMTDRKVELVEKRLKKNTMDQIKIAITRYGEIFRDTTYFFNHEYIFDDFMERKKVIDSFLDGGAKWVAYTSKLKGFRPQMQNNNSTNYSLKEW